MLKDLQFHLHFRDVEMIDPLLLRTDEGIKIISQSLIKRNHSLDSLNELEKLSHARLEIINRLETNQGQKNKCSKEIGQIYSSQKLAENEKEAQLQEAKHLVTQLGEQIKEDKIELENIELEFNQKLLYLPNNLNETVPKGIDENNNVVIQQINEIPKFSFEVKPHYQIAEKHNLYDSERAAKLSGARFHIYNEKLAQLERRVLNFMLEKHITKGYLERAVPIVVKDDCMKATGQYPKFQEEYYRLEKDAMNLIPTGEVPLTNIYADEILNQEDLPIMLTAATPCFRREAGSAGKDTRGLIRVHQFMKVELVKLCHPEQSMNELTKLTQDAEDILKAFNLCYRKVLLCSGDTSASSSITYDLEVYMPGMKRWMEISSCSNFQDYQARRAKIRYKDQETKKNKLVHTINGSGVAAGRLIAALLEYYQTQNENIDWDKIYSCIN